jgi:hypothetical protein
MPHFLNQGVGRSYLIAPSLVDQFGGNLFASQHKINIVSNLCAITSNEKQMMDIPLLLLEGILLAICS